MGLAVSEVFRGLNATHFGVSRSAVVPLAPVEEKPLVQERIPSVQQAVKGEAIVFDSIADAKTRTQIDHMSRHMRLLHFAQKWGLLILGGSDVVIGVRDTEQSTVIHPSVDHYVHRINARPRMPVRSTIFGG